MIYELCFTAPQRLDEPLSGLLTEAGSMGVVLENIGRKAVFSAELPFDRCRYKGYFADSVNRSALELAIRYLLVSHDVQEDCEIYWVELEDQDWQESWKRHFKPLLLGKNLLVLPSWLEPPEGTQNRLTIQIDPEMAFGSGSHETTWGCLETLEMLAGQQPLGTVLDMGTGSGILLICAMLLGADAAMGVDSDPVAVATCQRNCQINLASLVGYEERLSFQQSDQLPIGPFQTVLANILAPTLTAFFSQTSIQFRHCVSQGGHLIVSGILHEQATELQACACQHGFHLVTRRDIGEWSLLLLQREYET